MIDFVPHLVIVTVATLVAVAVLAVARRAGRRRQNMPDGN
jgi:hypothetical protein